MPARILRKEELLLLMMETATMEISSFLKKTKNRITIWSSCTIPRHTHKILSPNTSMFMLIDTLIPAPMTGTSLDVQQQIGGERKCGPLQNGKWTKLELC